MSIYSYDDKSESLNTINQIGLTQTHTISNPEISKAIEFISTGNYQAAYDHLKSRSADPEVINIKAVLLMRLGKPNQAVSILRSMVLDPTTLLLRPGVPDHIKLNFATALLMDGEVAGCDEILRTIQDKSNEQLIQLRADIRRWEKSLTILRWIDWKACGIAHGSDGLSMDHLPGKFDWELDSERDVQTRKSSIQSTTPSHKLAV